VQEEETGLAERTSSATRPLAARPRAGGSSRRRAEIPVSSRGRALGQLGWIAAIASCAFASVALYSYQASDPSFSVATVGPVQTAGGPAGAHLADALLQASGYAAWSVVPLGAWCAARLAGRVQGGWLNALLVATGVVLSAAALQLALPLHEGAFRPGGILGLLVGESLAAQAGRVGAALAVGVGLAGCATLLFGINWQPIAARAVDRVQAATPVATRVVAAAGRGVAAAGIATAKATASAGAAAVDNWRQRRAERALDALETEDLPDGAFVSVEEDPPSTWSARPPPAPRIRPPSERDAPTLPGGRTLVEAAWEAPESRYEVPRPAEFVAPEIDGAPVPAGFAAPVAPPRARGVDVEAHLEPTAPGRRAGSRPVPVDDMAVEGVRVAAAREVPPAPALAPMPVPAVAAEDVVSDEIQAGANSLAAEAPRKLPRPRRAKAGAEVLPGDLRSGGHNDDGSAVRETTTPFQLPPLSLLDDHPAVVAAADESRLHDLAARLCAKLKDFGVEGRVTAIRPGPVITLFEFEPAPGIKISRIANLADDLAMALRAQAVRVIAPIPGRGVVGVEVPNDSRQTVWARDVFASNEFRDEKITLPIVLGKDTEGRPFVADLARMPHLLVGGTTGSGKSVGINAMLVSLLLTRTPDELRLILVDPKQLEFELYKEIPHLLHPVVTEARLASKVLGWACDEMDRRYRLLGDWKVRNIDNYNAKVEVEARSWSGEKAREYFPEWNGGTLLPMPKKLPYIVVVIDELADLMMVASKDVETSIARLAQKARASGIHLIVATQSPRADVVTGLIRANMPSRLSYQVRTGTESRIILDQLGAQALLGKGDLLFLPPGASALARVHGPFLGDDEVRRVADHARAQGKPDYAPAIRVDDEEGEDGELEELDEEMGRYYDLVVDFAMEKGSVSTSMIQRHLKIGYNRACLLMERLEAEGIVGPADGAKPRKVLVERTA
jgi:S-DNA-T family DNA segregation ATPase FtsK/SpoIIIE